MISENLTPLVKFIKEKALLSERSYSEIAVLCGFKSTATIHLFVRGEVRLPLDKVASMAAAIGCESAELFMLALSEWFTPTLLAQMEQAFLYKPTSE